MKLCFGLLLVMSCFRGTKIIKFCSRAVVNCLLSLLFVMCLHEMPLSRFCDAIMVQWLFEHRVETLYSDAIIVQWILRQLHRDAIIVMWPFAQVGHR